MKQRSPLRARAAEETKRREAPLKAPRVPRISRWGREREGGGRARRRHVSPREPPAPSPPAICGRGRAANACRRRRRPEPDRMGGFGGIVPPSLNEGRAACACLGVAPTGGAPAAARGAQPPPSPRPLSRAWGGAVSRGTRLPCPLLRAAAARLSCRRSPRRHRAAGRAATPARLFCGRRRFPRRYLRRRHRREGAAPLSPPAICGRGGRRPRFARLFCGRRRFPRRYPAAAAPGMRTAAGLRRGHRTFREPPPSPRPLPAGVGGGGAGGAFPARYLRACAAGDEGCGRASAGTPDFPRAAPLSPPATCGRGGRRRRRRFPRPLPAGVRRRG